jgi:enamine deaminase RidA (YjgF/YER057c/UK114 family)
VNLVFWTDAGLQPPVTEAGVKVGDVLGGALIGRLSPACAPQRWPVQGLDAPLLDHPRDLVQELWRTDDECRSGEFEGIVFRRTAHMLFGVIELDEEGFSGSGRGRPLQDATEEAYSRIFRLLEKQDLPHLWRVWNYLADINGESNGLERYRQFNIGRYDAFLACKRAFADAVPAACTIGVRRGPLSIAFIAGRTPARQVENPRQVSAYHYPPEYGPRSPTFSRAVLIDLPGQESLFISGTASIVGHRTAHPGNVSAQCRETLTNIEAVVAEANRLRRSASFTLAALAYRVYLRNAGDLAAVRAVLSRRIGESPEIVCVQADICRHDLLVEIEAMASNPLGSC